MTLRLWDLLLTNQYGSSDHNALHCQTSPCLNFSGDHIDPSPLYDHLSWPFPTQTLWQSVQRFPKTGLFLVLKTPDYLSPNNCPLSRGHLAIALRYKRSPRLTFYTGKAPVLPNPCTVLKACRKCGIIPQLELPVCH
jgi:hypothetical protein